MTDICFAQSNGTVFATSERRAWGPQRPENDPVDHNPGLRPAQANSKGGPEGPGHGECNKSRAAQRLRERSNKTAPQAKSSNKQKSHTSIPGEPNWRNHH